MTYRIGDRCPDCGEYFGALVRHVAPPPEGAEVTPFQITASDAPTFVTCRNGHEHEPHPDWRKRPYPTPTFAR